MRDTTARIASGQESNEHAETVQYLTFYAGDERFALNILEVRELLEVSDVTRVPMAPDFIRGVINLRGNVVPLVDLGSRLDRGRSELTKRSCIILVEIESDNDSQSIGMLVDEVHEILEIMESQVQPVPNFGTNIRTDFMDAIAEIEGQFLILLNISHVLSVEELASLQTINKPSDSEGPKLQLPKADADQQQVN